RQRDPGAPGVMARHQAARGRRCHRAAGASGWLHRHTQRRWRRLGARGYGGPGYRAPGLRGIRGSAVAGHPCRGPAHPGRDARAAAMNEPPALPPPADPAPPPSENPAPAPPHWQRLAPLIPVLYLVGFVILAGAIIWLWRNPALPERPAVDPAEVAALSQRVQALEQRPTPRPPDLRPLENRIAALEKRTPPDLAPIESRLAALEQRQAPDLAPIEARIAALEQRPQVPGDVATKGDLAGVASRIDAIAGREDQLATRQQGLETNFGNKLDTVDQ